MNKPILQRYRQISQIPIRPKNYYERYEVDGTPIEKLKEKPLEKLFQRRKELREIKPDNIAIAKFLAKEVYITEAFVSRLSKATKRPIVVVSVLRTGKIYTSSIKESENLSKVELHYPSSYFSDNKMSVKDLNFAKQELIKMINNYKSKNPLFVFVDSSKNKRMPSSLVGLKDQSHEMYTKPEDSINGVLKQNNKNTIITHYNLIRGKGNDKLDYLPKYSPEQLNKIDAILFNPSKEVNKFIDYKNERKKWTSAPHDDYGQLLTKDYEDIVLFFVNQMKKSYNKRLKNEVKK